MTSDAPDRNGPAAPIRSTPNRLGSSEILVLCLFPVIVFGLLITTGNLTTGPRTTDDNQIFKLQIEFQESGFFRGLSDELHARFGMGRLFPVHCVHKILQAWFLGGNMFLWSVWVGVVGSLTAILLYLSMRLLGYAIGESIVFALITLLGEQSVLWWRLLHGEGIGMLLLAAGMLSMALRIRTGKMRYEFGFALLVSLSMLAKESFILIVPGMLFLKIWLAMRLQNVTVRSALKSSLLSLIWLTSLAAILICIIRFGWKKTHFDYTGWFGFDLSPFIQILIQHAWIAHFFLPLFGLLGVLIARRYLASPPLLVDSSGNPVGGSPPASPSKDQPSLMHLLWMPLLFWGLIAVPQLLLYMRSGMLNIGTQAHYSRYIVPAIMGYSLLIAEVLRLIRLSPSGEKVPIGVAYLFIGLSLCVKGFTAYQQAEHFALLSQANDAWFDAIADHIGPDEPIVLVYLNGMPDGYQTQVSLQAYYILRERYGKRDIYFLPIPDEPSIEAGRLEAVQADTRHHGLKMRHVNQMPSGSQVGAVAIINFGYIPGFKGNAGQYVEHFLLEDYSGTWFKPEEFQRVMTPLGYVVYFRKTQ